MSSQLPTAVINGIERFGAKKLATLLGDNDIKVFGVGEYPSGWAGFKNFEFKNSVEEIEETINYWFDFKEDKEVWARAENDHARLTVIGVNRSVVVGGALEAVRTGWRVINVHGVYGPGMDGEGEQLGEVEYLIKAIRLAVGNKNLRLPGKDACLRLIALDDFREAISRATFLSGTEGEVFEIWGRTIAAEEIAKVLIDEAKMTRFKVEVETVSLAIPDEEEITDNWRKLRWQPETEFDQGIKETMQYFFSRIDEESRRKKDEPIKKAIISEVEKEEIVEEIVKEDNKKVYEVMIEEDEPVVEETETKEFEEIKPLIVKNSNVRPVALPSEEKSMSSQKFEEVKKTVNETLSKEAKRDTKVLDVKEKVEKYGRWLLLGGGLLVIGLVGSWGWKNYRIFRNLSTVKQLVTERKYDEANSLIQKTMKLVKNEETAVNEWGGNRLIWGRRYQEVLKVVEQGLVLGEEVVDISQRGEKINEAIFNDKEVNWDTELAAVKTDLQQGGADLGVLQARLAGDWNWIPSRWKGQFSSLKVKLEEATKMASLAERSIDFLPEILGTDGKRRDYMVLLQNESELRAGGGFIGSWAVLSFEGGKLLNFEIQDIYEADGQLKGHVEPPTPIKNFLGEANWYMRDANWQADFPTASKDIQWFLEKETGRKVDGVIGVNIAVAKALLGVVGEVYVPDFKETINKDNIYEQAEFYSETNSFAGSTQKASFLGGVGKQLFEAIKTLRPEKRLELIEAGLQMLENNEIQLAINDKKTAAIVADLGWSGAIYNGKCATEKCFADYLYVVESNFGVNKANYFLYRSIDQNVDISEQTIGRVVKITYENTAKSNAWPGGDYKNYLRVYIPVSANLAEVSVAEANGGVKRIIQGSELTVNEVKGKKEVGFLVIVPAGKKEVVELRYSDSISIGKQDSFSYLDYVQKQSGFGDTALVTLMSIPDGWQPSQVEPTASLVNGKLLFNQKLDGDIKMGVEISK